MRDLLRESSEEWQEKRRQYESHKAITLPKHRKRVAMRLRQRAKRAMDAQKIGRDIEESRTYASGEGVTEGSDRKAL